MFFGILQSPTALPLLDNQPECNPSKYLHTSSKLGADFFLDSYDHFKFSAFLMWTGSSPWYVRLPPTPRILPASALTWEFAPHRLCTLKPCSGKRHSSSKHRCVYHTEPRLAIQHSLSLNIKSDKWEDAILIFPDTRQMHAWSTPQYQSHYPVLIFPTFVQNEWLSERRTRRREEKSS